MSAATAFACVEQRCDGRGPLQRRAIEAAGDFDAARRQICGCSARIARCTRSASARVIARASIVARASAGTTLARVPPETTPTVSVTPFAGSCRSSMARICRASSRIALTPLPGSRPACAETPRAIISNWPTPLRLVLSAPPGSDGSNTSTASLFALRPRSARAMSCCRSLRRSSTASRCWQPSRRAAIEHRARRQHREPDAGLHVEHAGPVQLAAFALERHALRAGRPATRCRSGRAAGSAAGRCRSSARR